MSTPGKHKMTDLQIIPTPIPKIKLEEVEKELKMALPDIEKKIGKEDFKLMCRTLAIFASRHEDLKIEFFKNALIQNIKTIEEFYRDKAKEFPKANPAHIYAAAVSAVIIGNVYNIDPLRILILAQKESGFNAGKVHKNRDGTKDLGLFQVNDKNNPEKTYQIDPKYELTRFNRTIVLLGGYILTSFPRGLSNPNVTQNTIGATLTLIEKIRLTKNDWEKTYTAYNGSLDNPVAKAYGKEVQGTYLADAKKYKFQKVKSDPDVQLTTLNIR